GQVVDARAVDTEVLVRAVDRHAAKRRGRGVVEVDADAGSRPVGPGCVADRAAARVAAEARVRPVTRDGEAAARAGAVQHDPVGAAVRGDVLEGEPAGADVRARHVQGRSGRRVDRVGRARDVDGAATGCAEAGATRRVDVE